MNRLVPAIMLILTLAGRYQRAIYPGNEYPLTNTQYCNVDTGCTYPTP